MTHLTYNSNELKADSRVELSRLNTGKRASPKSTRPGAVFVDFPLPFVWPVTPPLLDEHEVVAETTEEVDDDEDSDDEMMWLWGEGLISRGLGGGLGMIDDILLPANGKLPPLLLLLVWNGELSGKKLTIELVGLSDKEPVGLARSEPVDMDMGGDKLPIRPNEFGGA